MLPQTTIKPMKEHKKNMYILIYIYIYIYIYRPISRLLSERYIEFMPCPAGQFTFRPATTLAQNSFHSMVPTSLKCTFFDISSDIYIYIYITKKLTDNSGCILLYCNHVCVHSPRTFHLFPCLSRFIFPALCFLILQPPFRLLQQRHPFPLHSIESDYRE